jgi:FHS family L-fucose permease-like MFS transporter
VQGPIQTNSDAPGQGSAVASGSRIAPLVVVLFFAWGFATVLIDTLIPKLKGLFQLNYTEAMLTQFAFFLGYLVFSIPASFLLARIGYVRQIVVGLVVMALGCMLFSPAAQLGVYPVFLLALFVMAAGITTLQVAANPLIALLGSPATSHSRLNLAQAFNSLGTTVGPLVGAALILQGGVVAPDPARIAPGLLETFRKAEANAVQAPFLGIAVVLLVLAVVFWRLRRSPAGPTAAVEGAPGFDFGLLRRPRLALGAVSIFVYVGAEVSIGSLMINYLMLEKTLGVAAATAGHLVALYWGGAMVGRFIGSAVLRWIPAGMALCFCALGASLLACTSAATLGVFAAIAVIAIGLFNSIMFPTIFTLAIEGLGERTPQGSGLLCLAIVGGAIVPLITGRVADLAGLSASLIVPALCYLWIAVYGWLSARLWVATA